MVSCQWRIDNPGEDASLGLTADIFLCQSRWLTGLASLWKHDSVWPMQDELFGEIANDDPEVIREVWASVLSLSTPRTPLLRYTCRCSSCSLLVKVVAWFWYRNNLLKASKGDKPRNSSLMLITLEEIQWAEGEILKHVQWQSFATLRCLQSQWIRLFFRETMIHVSRLIIYHYYKVCGHSGREHVLSLIPERFWITQGSSAVKSVLAKCVICQRLQVSLCQQKMANQKIALNLADHRSLQLT